MQVTVWMRIGVLAAAAGLTAAGSMPGAGSANDELPGSPNVCLAGTGSPRWCGDHGPARKAKVSGPVDVSPIRAGGYLIADTGNHVIRRVDRRGRINTVAGYGIAGRQGDGRAAADARLNTPTGVAALSRGGFLIADQDNSVVRRVYRRGVIRTVAGTGQAGSSGDGGPATMARLVAPADVAELPGGGFLIADSAGRRVRAVSRRGTISTVAGTGAAPQPGPNGDGGPATAASIGWPVAVAPEPNGGFLIADAQMGTVRRVDPGGTITTVLGGEGLVSGVALEEPSGVASTGDGGFLVSDLTGVRRVYRDGSAVIVAGTGEAGLGRERGPATEVALARPSGVAWLRGGRALVADRDNDRVRRIVGGRIATVVGFDRRDPLEAAPPGPPPVPPPPGTPPLAFTDGRRPKCSGDATGAEVALRILRFDPRKASGKRRVGVRVSSTNLRRARFSVEVRRRGRVRARGSARFRYGKHTIRLDRRLRPDKYRVEVTVRIRFHGTRTSCISRTVTLVLAK